MPIVRESTWATDNIYGLESDWIMCLPDPAALRYAYFKVKEMIEFSQSREGQASAKKELVKLTEKVTKARNLKNKELGYDLPYFSLKPWHVPSSTNMKLSLIHI